MPTEEDVAFISASHVSPVLVRRHLPLARRCLGRGMKLPAGIPRGQSVDAGRDQLHLLGDRRRLDPQTGERAVSTQVKVTCEH